ncbi:hypothetical protein KCU95_g46, partial [Aureobasidium melanogenum]
MNPETLLLVLLMNSRWSEHHAQLQISGDLVLSRTPVDLNVVLEGLRPSTYLHQLYLFLPSSIVLRLLVLRYKAFLLARKSPKIPRRCFSANLVKLVPKSPPILCR